MTACFECGGLDERSGYCLRCGHPWPCLSTAPSDRAPDVLIGISEAARLFPALAVEENTIAVVIDRRAGFVPCILWLTVSPQSSGVAVVPAFPLRVDVVAGPDAAAMALSTAPQYILHNRADRTFFTVASDGYHGIAIPMLTGSALPFGGIRVSGTFPVATQVRVAWGYRPLDSRPPGITGSAG